MSSSERNRKPIMAKRLPRHSSVHAAGVVIARCVDGPVPLMKRDRRYSEVTRKPIDVSQYVMQAKLVSRPSQDGLT